MEEGTLGSPTGQLKAEPNRTTAPITEWTMGQSWHNTGGVPLMGQKRGLGQV